MASATSSDRANDAPTGVERRCQLTQPLSPNAPWSLNARFAQPSASYDVNL
jgi:hypothetical protein